MGIQGFGVRRVLRPPARFRYTGSLTSPSASRGFRASTSTSRTSPATRPAASSPAPVSEASFARLATQRPSVDVITGLIKASFPSRIIIDQMGAEKLLGRGDMLFTSSWNPFPSRVQGAFLSEDDVERVVTHVKSLGEPDYISDEIFFDEEDEEGALDTEASGDEMDPLFEKGVEIVRTFKKASASFLQRRLGVGYNRAARMIELMEEMGIVGPQNGSKPREIVHS